MKIKSIPASVIFIVNFLIAVWYVSLFNAWTFNSSIPISCDAGVPNNIALLKSSYKNKQGIFMLLYSTLKNYAAIPYKILKTSVWAYFEAFYLKIPEARCTLLYETIFGNWKFFKNDEKCFLFHLKSSFCSWKICSQILALNTLKLSCRPLAFT